jgi:hypothetical protein
VKTTLVLTFLKISGLQEPFQVSNFFQGKKSGSQAWQFSTI